MRAPVRLVLVVLCLVPLAARAGDAPLAPEQADLVRRLRAAPQLKIENVGAPMRSTRGGGVEWVPNPDGKTWDVLVRFCHTYWGPHTTFAIDLGTGEVKKFVRPHALYSRAAMGPDGKYYSTLTGKGGTAFQVYDPGKNEMYDLEEVAIDVDGETRPLCIAPDGLMYGAGNRGPRVLGITFNPADHLPERKQGRFALDYGYADRTAILYCVNIETGAVLWKKLLPYPVGFRTNENAMGKDGFDFRTGPDGKIWSYTGGRFTPCTPDKDWWFAYLGPDVCMIRINPEDGAIDVVGKIAHPGEIAFSGRDIILSGGDRYLLETNMNLRRIRNIVPR